MSLRNLRLLAAVGVFVGLALAVSLVAGSLPGGIRGSFDPALPSLGTQLGQFPAGEGKVVADAACLSCHSADLVLQQRLTEKQWEASLTKMAAWGAELTDEERRVLLRYLAASFGPENDRFRPVVTRPAGR